MPKAKKLDSGNYRVLVYAGKDTTGKRRYKSFTDPNKKKAEYAAAEFALKHRKLNNKGKLTFKQAADLYIENKENVLSPSTIRGYKAMLKVDYPRMLNIQVDKLAIDDSVQKQMNTNAKTHSSKSLFNQFNFVTAVMRFCGYPVSKDDVTLKPKEKHSIPVPTKQEAEKIIKILGQDPEIQCQILLALTCSLRLSEIVDLTVDDIQGNDVLVQGATVRGVEGLIHKDTNKSSAGHRRDTMPPELAKLIKQRCKKVGTGKLFTLHPSTTLERFQRLLTKNSLPKYTIQSLRHCFAATMHALKVPDKYIMEMGGWGTNSVMKNIYQYTFEDETKVIKEKANNYYDKVMKNSRKNPPQNKNATRVATRSTKKSVK